jgi:hypothetical protein
MNKLIAVLKTERSDAGGPAPRGRVHSISNPMYEQLKVRLVDAEGQVASLQRQVTDAAGERERMETMARSTPGVHAEYENLDRDYSVLRKNYEELLGRREAANIAEAADTQAEKVKLQIVDPPRVPRIAVSPNRLLLIPGVLLAGLAGGSGLAFLLGQTDRSFRTLDDLRVLGLPVLGGISLLDTVPRRKRLISAFGFGVAVMLLAVACGGLLTQLLREAALVWPCRRNPCTWWSGLRNSSAVRSARRPRRRSSSARSRPVWPPHRPVWGKPAWARVPGKGSISRP